MADKTEQKAKSSSSWMDDPVLVEFHGYMQSESGRRVSIMLKERKYTAKETEVTYRVLNHWTELGLLEDDREEGKGWRKFSRLDIVWSHILVALRNFGLPLERLLKVKETLDHKFTLDSAVNPISEAWEKMQFTLFEFYIASAMLRNRPAYLRIFEDGDAELLFYEQYQEALTDEHLAHHILIDLNLIIKKMYPNSSFAPDYNKGKSSLTDEEAEVLLMLRTGNYDRVSVRLKGGNVETLEAEETVEGRKFVDILKDDDFQNVEITKRDGKIIKVKRTTLKKLKPSK